MYRGAKALEGKGKKGSGKKVKRWAVGEHPPMTALEFFIYVCTVLFVMVFAVMQGVFLYKLHRYEESYEDASQPAHTNPEVNRVLSEEKAEPTTTTAIVAVSNHKRIEFMANSTAREFTKWPPLDAIIDDQDGKVVGNPQFLLDFGILGFEKSGK